MWTDILLFVTTAVPTIEILGVPIASLTPEAALDAIEHLYDRDDPAFVAHVNVHTLNLATADPVFRDVLHRADLVLNDGKGVMLAARMLNSSFPADLNGNFFGPLLLGRAAERGWRVFLLGARPGVAERAARRLHQRLPELAIAGVRDGFFSIEDEPAIARRIRSSEAGLVMVGLGNPAQERWIDRYLRDTGARLGVGVGAFFDFQAGAIPRAPGLLNRLGLEWAYRLAREPRRMWRRYLVGNPLFLARVANVRLRGRFNRR
jgi:exopolysaccharide biosynthesis WecB/TagA/CpsF family protein